MSRVCEITGRWTSVWNRRSKSMRSTKRKYRVNLVKKKIRDPETWFVFETKISTRALRTLKKKGLI